MNNKNVLGLVLIALSLYGASVGCGGEKREATAEDFLNRLAEDGGSFGTYDDGLNDDGGTIGDDGTYGYDGGYDEGYAADYGDNHSFETEN
jgi:hypothetical protein